VVENVVCALGQLGCFLKVVGTIYMSFKLYINI